MLTPKVAQKPAQATPTPAPRTASERRRRAQQPLWDPLPAISQPGALGRVRDGARLHDSYEAEADRVATQGMSASGVEQVGRNSASRPLSARSNAATHGGHREDLGPGESLEPWVRADMEARFGYDLGGVRVHTGVEADRSARAYGALAYTRGRDVVFSQGRYAPSTPAGGRLLAHELMHVVQQHVSADVPSPQLMPVAARFQDEPTLDEISDGKKVLKQGDRGEAVIRITTALSELGYFGTRFIDEIFGTRLRTAVTKFQDARALTGMVPAGTVEKQTFDVLDNEFAADFQVERNTIAKQKSPDILKETQRLDPAERAASARVVSTETPVSPTTGLPPVFQADIPGKGNYGDRLRAALDKEIVDEWNAMAKGKAAAHGSAGALYDAPAVDAIAAESEKAVKAVFGEYIKGRAVPSLKMGSTVEDAWKQKEADLSAGGKPAEDDAVDWRVQKILDGDDAVKALDREHGAIHTRGPEQAIIAPIKADMMTKYRAKLLELHKAWPGFEDKGVVFVQLFKGATPDRQRFERWSFFQTFIHEFIHALEHPDHIKYREKLAEQKGGFTLREGTTDYFTKIVWSNLVLDDPLRAAIEGPVHDPTKPIAIPGLDTYPEALNAERLAGVVGIRNVAAAFFLGKVKLVGAA